MRLVYKGDGDYDVITDDDGLVIELTYDGSDYAVGTWTFWSVRLDDHRFGGTWVVGPGAFFNWLESEARQGGQLPDEPEVAA